MKDFLSVDGPESFLSALDVISERGGSVPYFKGWPIFHVEVIGERYNGTMTPKLMDGFIKFHEQLLRAYADVRYGSPSLARLTNIERAELDIIFQITKGSTDGKGPLDEILNKLLSALPMNKMSGLQVTLLLIVVVLSLAGYLAFKELTIAEMEKVRLDSAQESSQTNAKLVEKLVDALSSKDLPGQAERLRDRANEGYRAIASGAPDAESMKIQGDHYDAQDLERIRSQEPPDRIRAERREDVYIEMIKRHNDYLSLTLRLPGEDYTFPGKVDLDTFDSSSVNKLFDSFRDTKPLRLFHFSVVQSGRIVRSTVLAVDNVTGSLVEGPIPKAP